MRCDESCFAPVITISLSQAGPSRQTGCRRIFSKQLLTGPGRPWLIAGSAPTPALTGTIMVCWKETAEAARAVNAAMPFLIRAKRVVIVSIVEDDENVADALSDVARQLGWNGVRSEIRTIAANGAAVPGLLSSAAQDCGADLVVLGAYGRARMHEIFFGSCTQTMIRNARNLGASDALSRNGLLHRSPPPRHPGGA